MSRLPEIHLEPRLRIKKPILEFGEFEYLETAAIILSWLTPIQKQKLYERKSLDFSLDISEGDYIARFRGSVYFDRNYLCSNFRRINDKTFNMDQIGIPKLLQTG